MPHSLVTSGWGDFRGTLPGVLGPEISLVSPKRSDTRCGGDEHVAWAGLAAVGLSSPRPGSHTAWKWGPQETLQV